jgi:hypothetical protein
MRKVKCQIFREVKHDRGIYLRIDDCMLFQEANFCESVSANRDIRGRSNSNMSIGPGNALTLVGLLFLEVADGLVPTIE